MTKSSGSGHLLSNPSLGIYCPAISSEAALVCSLAFPRSFMQSEDSFGHKAFSKSTALEALGFLAPLLVDPIRFIGKKMVIVTDNAVAVLVLKKGYSSDLWATTLCRAARVVAAGLCCQIMARWEPRRSSQATRISDDLTHNLLTELEEKEVDAYLERAQVSFPEPILGWMAKPRVDHSLGNKCLQWILKTFPVLVDILRN